MNFSAYAIRNPLFVIMLFLLLTVGGVLSFQKMTIQQFPDIDFPMVIVTVTLPGASPERMEMDVAKYIEDKVSSVQGVEHIRSVMQTGVATVMIEFELEKPLQEALDDVRSAVDEIIDSLPAEANEPIINKQSTTGLPVVTYTVSAENMDKLALSWFVDDVIAKRLSGIQGVGAINRVGGVDREIRVAVDPIRLQAFPVSITDISEQIDYLQQDAPSGEAAVGSGKQPIRTLAALDTAQAIGDLQIDVGNGQFVRLQDIATISDTYAEQTTKALLDGKEVVGFNITRSRGASEVTVAQKVGEALNVLMTENPQLHIEKVFDMAKPVEEDYHASIRMLVEGGLLAVVVVFLFLRNARATFIAATALPLSIIPTFIGIYFLSFSINVISLLALSLVIGVLVDDAIVEVENIMRHLRMGKTPYQAALEAADEIGLAVVATTFTLIAVFLPTAFMSGIIGQFFKQFGWTASIAIFASLLVARLLTPMMSAYLLKPDARDEQKSGRLMKNYLSLVHWTVRWRWLTLIVVVVLFIGSLQLTPFISKAFMPEDDFSQSRVEIELAPGSTLEDTEQVSEWTRTAIADIEGVEHVYTSIGGSEMSLEPDAGGSGEVRKATINIVLSERGMRPLKTEIESQISTVVEYIPGARFKVGLSNGGEQVYKVALTSDNLTALKQKARDIINELRALPESRNVLSDEGLVREELKIKPDYVKMAERGVTTAAIANTIRVATSGDYEEQLSKLNLGSRQIPVVVTLPESARGDVDTLLDLQVMGTRGPVRIGEVATLTFDSGPSGLKRYDRARTISITAQPHKGNVGELVAAARQTPILNELLENPTGVVQADEQGQAENMQDLFSGFAIAMGIGVLCIYGVLVLLFKKVLQPFTILMALPLSIGGAFIGLLLAGSSLSMPSMIGLIMLMGIATKNSILLVDYAIIAEERGRLSRIEAVIDACHKRARPIIMTTIAMGAGMLPLIIGWGEADPSFRRPMAIAVFGGLITSTMLSLIVIPTVYTIVDDLNGLLKKLFSGMISPHEKPTFEHQTQGEH